MCTKIINSPPNILSPKLDVVFQALFGEVGSEQITSKFLEAILNQKIESIDLSKNLILRRDYPDDKLGVLDIIAKINDSEYCNIEMQVAEQEEIIERILFYWSKLYTKQIKSGKSYDSLEKTIVILITNFNVQGLENLEYHTTWKIIEEKYRTTILTEKLEFHIIELPKIIENSNDNDNLLDWLLFLDNPKSERVIEKMKENKELKQANEKLETLSQDEKMKRLAELREKAIYEYNTAASSGFKRGMKNGLAEGMKQGIERGIKEGIEQGIKSSKHTIALELLKNNVSIDIIKKSTNLSDEEIEKLRQQLSD